MTDKASGKTSQQQEPPLEQKQAPPFECTVTETEMNFEGVKNAIYREMQTIVEGGSSATRLRLSQDLYEILNKRLVFKTAAHKEASNFITPYGNLLVAINIEAPVSGTFVIE